MICCSAFTNRTINEEGFLSDKTKKSIGSYFTNAMVLVYIYYSNLTNILGIDDILHNATVAIQWIMCYHGFTGQ